MNFKQWWNSPKGIRIVNMILMALNGLFLIGLSIAGTIMTLDETLIEVDWSFAVMSVYAFSGMVILLCIDKSPRFTVFLGGITFAVMNMIQQSVILANIGLVPSAILAVIMDFAMIICSILCLLGDRHSSLRLLGICIIHFASVFTAQMLDVLEITDHMFGYTTSWWMIVECLFLIVFMVLLLRPGIREESLNSRLKKGITVVSSKMVSESASVRAKDIDALTGKDTSDWNEGPVGSEFTAEISDGRRIVYLTSCRWKGEDEIRMNIAPAVIHRPYGNGFVLRGHSVEETESARYLRLYGDDGYFVRLLIIENDEIVDAAPEEPEGPIDPVNYVGDKMTTG